VNLDDLRALVDAALERALPSEAAPALVVEPMRYALSGGGKRLRPCLTLASAEAIARRDHRPVDAAIHAALPGACAVELVHCYSLVHDDLPAMDDDTLRRGRPTVHVAYGEGIAILAGDGLLTEAFRLLAETPSPVSAPDAAALPAEARLTSIRMLALAAGAIGMVGGQALDLAGGEPPTEVRASEADRLTDMHARKTGALIRAAATMGAAAMEADADTVQRVDDYARELGLAFQIVDDILDVEGSAAELGKTAGKDAADHKLTYPALYGVAKSRELAAACIARAHTALAAASLAGRLGDIADWSLGRRK
jgi:geranylgeranyl pyrophosphate synthase